MSKPQLKRFYVCMYELKQHKSCFDEECLGSLEKRKQAKMQWLQDPKQRNADNINNVKRKLLDISRTKRRNI
jgi:hypothetical protein